MKNNEDTISLLEEVCAGARMGADSLMDMRKKVNCTELDGMLNEFYDEHVVIADEAQAMLFSLGEKDKEAPIMAKMMSDIKTGIKLSADGSDGTIAELITDGCNMGIKTLSKKVNELTSADPQAVDTARRLIDLETDMARQLRSYL